MSLLRIIELYVYSYPDNQSNWVTRLLSVFKCLPVCLFLGFSFDIFFSVDLKFLPAMDRRLPMKSILKGKDDGVSKKKRRVFKMSSKVRSILDRSRDNWSTDSSVSSDLFFYEKFNAIFLSLFKGDLLKIYEEPSSVESKCTPRSVMRLASMIQGCFTDDKFLTGKSAIILYSRLNHFSRCFLSLNPFSCISLVFWICIRHNSPKIP